MIAMAVGTALALLALGYVLYPLVADFGARRECSGCGAKAEAGALFCTSCGAEVR